MVRAFALLLFAILVIAVVVLPPPAERPSVERETDAARPFPEPAMPPRPIVDASGSPYGLDENGEPVLPLEVLPSQAAKNRDVVVRVTSGDTPLEAVDVDLVADPETGVLAHHATTDEKGEARWPGMVREGA